jgi:hypothetical protein
MQWLTDFFYKLPLRRILYVLQAERQYGRLRAVNLQKIADIADRHLIENPAGASGRADQYIIVPALDLIYIVDLAVGTMDMPTPLYSHVIATRKGNTHDN